MVPRPLKVSINVSNLSNRSDRVQRTGIPEVNFQLLKEILVSDTPEVQWTPILSLPLSNFVGTPFFKATHFNASRKVLLESIAELGLQDRDIVERWPYTAPLFRRFYSRTQYEKACLEQIAETDLFFEVSASDSRNVVDAVKRMNPNLKNGVCVHDLGPLRHPGHVPTAVHRWFQREYLSYLKQSDFSISVSRQTALDVELFMGAKAKNNFYGSLPSPLCVREKTLDFVPTLKQRMPFLKKNFYICSVATLEARKNLDYLIKGFHRFQKIFPHTEPIYLILVGAKGWRHESYKIAGQGVEQIVYPGFLSRNELDSLMSNALCLVLPSHYEGFGLPIAEARALGVPVICAANSSLPEASAMNASFVRLDLEDDLACAIQQILRLKKTSLGSSSVLSSGDYFATVENWQAVLKNWLAVFQVVKKGDLL